MNDSVMPVATTPALRRSDPQARPGTLLTLSHDVIARRAYEIYDRNDRQQGQCQQNWQQAERELREQSETACPAADPGSAPSSTGLLGPSPAGEADAGTIAVKGARGATLWPGPHPVRSTRHAAIRMGSGRVEGAGAAIRLTQPRTEG